MTKYLTSLNLEHFILFVAFPVLLFFNISIYIKLAVGLIALVYVVLISVKHKYFKSQNIKLSKTKKLLFLKHLAVKFLFIIVLTSLITYAFYRDELLNAISSNPGQYLIILGVYVFFSVVPQEFIYRKFYFLRYQSIFKTKAQLIVINTFTFSLGHLFFQNLLVVLITLVGGLIFSLSYYKFQSFKLICIEHSLYGLWLYTIGLGGLLGFPVE